MTMSNPRRVHPLAIIPNAISFLRNALLPFLFGSISLVREHPLITVFGAFALLVLTGVFGFLFWYNFSYTIEAGELRVQKGIFNKQRRYIPLERIQSIDIQAGLILQLVGLVQLQIETASEGKVPEISLAGITREEAEALKKVLSDAKAARQPQAASGAEAGEAPAPEQIQYRLTMKELIFMSLTSASIGLIAPFLSAVIEPLTNFSEQFVAWLGLFQNGNPNLLEIGVLILLTLILSAVGSIILTMLAYARFTLTREGDVLKISRGLLEKRELTLPLDRLQGIRIVEGLLRQPFGYVTLHVESGGGYGKKQGQTTVLHPLVKRERVTEFLAEIAPGFELGTALRPLPKRAKRRYGVRPLLLALAIALVPSVLFYPYGLFALLLLPVFLAWGLLQYRDGGWSSGEACLTMRRRLIARTTVVIPWRKVQSYHRGQSLFQKRAALATASVRIISGGEGKEYKIVDVEADQALMS
ncbi:putative membrane protein [Tumebacillus sp. BK434]|uniref:PH domain-containing protein n=1 Tax=Tumebacillus sp. BK434 TaxID=2512169 RepID=UPI0010F2D6DA|nr:PH domain-containing protein [Tumebacillus sp. BK434]TCP55655.1 putative membrane protein [Tumebacillus sp. BK434]